MASQTPFYARYLFSLSPTYSHWARLSAKDIHTSLRPRPGFEGQDIWFYLNHPIRWVRVVGVVVAFDDLEKRINITLDDGSGYHIDLISWKDPPPGVVAHQQKFNPEDLTNVAVGSIIKAKGSINEFRGKKQVMLRRISVLADTNEEVVACAETTAFKRDVLSSPWFVSAEIVEKEKQKLVQMEEKGERRERKRRKMEMKGVGVGKENILCGEKQEKRKVEVGGVLSPKRQRTVELEGSQGSSFRGHRRPAGIKPPPIPPEREAASNTYRGRRRTTPPSPRSRRTHTPINIPIPEREATPPPPTSTYRGRRRTTPAPSIASPRRRHTPALETLPDPPPEQEAPISTYRGRRRTTPAPLIPSPRTRRIPTPDLNLPESFSSYRGSKPPSEHSSQSKPSPQIEHTSPLPEQSSYRGRRRVKDAKALQQLVESLAPGSQVECASYRDLRRVLKRQREEGGQGDSEGRHGGEGGGQGSERGRAEGRGGRSEYRGRRRAEVE